ncbi:MAG TPA: hypothetical protein PKM16_03235 [Bacteroidia bacterium]|nr:hypothetical protein [Bacteroidia bacterium]
MILAQKLSLNEYIVHSFINGKKTNAISKEVDLDISYVHLVLYQEGLHYSVDKTTSKSK